MSFTNKKDRHCLECGLHYVWAIEREVTEEEAEEYPWMEGGGILDSPSNEKEEATSEYWVGDYGDNEYTQLSERDAENLWGSAPCKVCEKWLREVGLGSIFDCYEEEEDAE